MCNREITRGLPDFKMQALQTFYGLPETPTAAVSAEFQAKPEAEKQLPGWAPRPMSSKHGCGLQYEVLG